MKFLADMGISQSTVRWLREKGYDAVHLIEEGLHRMLDTQIIEKGKKENRVILTCDLHFGYIMAISKGISPSVITFRLDDESPNNINDKLDQILNESYNVLEKGAIISVDETKYRVRLLPI
jgi:predicted nuclease of predicted toxin-antitoxin system